MRRLLSDLYPICRSITGPGVRSTLDRIAEEVPLVRSSLVSGTRVFDWTVPDEWVIRDAWIAPEGSNGNLSERIVDFSRSNLHVVGYSTPIDAVLTLDELRPHLHTLPDRPDLVPYRTSYYTRTWGFCVADSLATSMRDQRYRVVVDSDLHPGRLDWGEVVIKGATDETVVFSTHICHPSLGNDNLTGIAVLVDLARAVAARPRRLTYRFLFVPGTIGSLAWLQTNRDVLDRVTHGLVVTGLGDSSQFTYKQSRRGDAAIDRIMAALLRETGGGRVRPWSPYGYDERQYCSPGFDLPFGRLTRGVHGEYPEYHTSADDLEFVDDAQLNAALHLLEQVVDVIEANGDVFSLCPFGEPQLGRRGLYSPTGGSIDARSVEMAYLWVLDGADRGDLVAVAERSGLPLASVIRAAERLRDVGLLETMR